MFKGTGTIGGSFGVKGVGRWGGGGGGPSKQIIELR